jgi:hypothetical protein
MNQISNSFAGVERRQHAVVVTRNSEYHVRRGQVVAVRQRGASDWSRSHKALQMRIDGDVERGWAMPLPGPPMYLVGDGEGVTTSRVIAVERPSKETVEQYPVDDAAHE